MADIYLTDIAHRGDLVVTPAGDLETSEGLENLRQALFHRLVTQPGTLLHRPNFGVGIKSFQNAISSLANQSEIFSRIQEQYAQDPRVEAVTGIIFKVNAAQPERTEILVRVKPIGLDELQMKFIPFGDVA